jgi:hypothetical protein
VDAYHLYEENQLVCQPCRMAKKSGASSPISFLGQSKWYKRYWKIDLAEWLENYQCLPVNADCARKWLKDRNHRNNCQCLEQESKEIYELFASSLKENKEKLEKECRCEASNKPRTPYYDSANYGYAYCEICETRIAGAGKHGVIKNRNDPRFWGLKVPQKVLCGNCLEQKRDKMIPLRRAKFKEYKKLGRL